MKNLEEILKEYEDFELAFLIKFKYDSYLEHSQKAINTELQRRNLTQTKILSLQHEYLGKVVNDGMLHCPRCFSTKIIVDSVDYWNNFSDSPSDRIVALDGLSGKETNKNKMTCVVCDYVISDPNAGNWVNFKSFIKKLFKKY